MDTQTTAQNSPSLRSLDTCYQSGFSGTVKKIDLESCQDQTDDLERLLLDMGITEGVQITLLHQGPFGGDPMALEVDHMRVAIRRSQAAAIWIEACDGGQ